jgi:hypothetical protein
MVPAGSDRIPRVPPYSGYHLKIILYVYRAVTSFGLAFQPVPLRTSFRLMVLQPRHCLNNAGLGCFHFARHYSGNHFCFIFLRVLRCFSSPGLPNDRSLYPDRSGWVAPFGYPRIKGYLHLPVAFRSLSRPSSP